jgi:hypothetical protein
MKGVDYSWARPGGKAIRAAGFEFAMRYVPYPGDGGKGLTFEEIADLRANGLAIGLVFESTAGRMLDGYSAGVADALQCAASVDALAFPVTLPVYFACDFDAQPAQYAALDDYLQGAASELGLMRVGVYGGYHVIEHCHEVGSAAYFWQTYAWSGGHVSDWAHIFQNLNGQTLNGGAVDYNAAAAEFGQWKPEEDEMTPEQFTEEFTKNMGKLFPAYIKAYFERGFSAANGIVEPGEIADEGPIKPWMADIEARFQHLPGIAGDGGGS